MLLPIYDSVTCSHCLFFFSGCFWSSFHLSNQETIMSYISSYRHIIGGNWAIFWLSTQLSRQAWCLITVDKESRWEFASQTREDWIVKQGRSTKQLTPAAAQYTSDTGYRNPFNKQQTHIVATSVTNTELCRIAEQRVIYRFLDIL